jgi:hypothetical protein
MPAAVRGHVSHRSAWYAALVGPFVCPASRLSELEPLTPARGLEVALTVPDGVAALREAIAGARNIAGLDLVAVEVPVRDAGQAQVALAAAAGISTYAEVPSAADCDRILDVLVDYGGRAKLRTGGVTAQAFPTERAVAQFIVAATDRKLPFKCTAGLHRAIRHTDAATGFEHHGYLNVVVSAAAAAAGAPIQEVAQLLGCRDCGELVTRAREISGRGLLTSYGTCSISEPVDDLVELGLIEAPAGTDG